MKKRLLAIVAAAVMFAAVLPVSMAASDLKKPVGTDISYMNTTDTYDEPYTGEIFSEYQLTVLNVWATWCPPCTGEMPHFQKLYENYRDMDVNVMGVLFEDINSTVERANNLRNYNGYTYPSLRMDSVLKALYEKGIAEVNGIPMTFLVDNSGTVISAKTDAFLSYGELETWVLTYWKTPVLRSVDIPKTAEVSADRMIALQPVFAPACAQIDSVTWTSSDETVAKVSDYGLVTGISKGLAIITVTVKSDTVTFKASCNVTVNESFADDGKDYCILTDKAENQCVYAVVAECGGMYYMMTPQKAVDGTYRLLGTEIAAEDMALVSGADGEKRMAFTNFSEECLWYFDGNDTDGYYISNVSTGEYLNSYRADGVFRLSLGNRAYNTYVTENGGLKTVTEGRFTETRRYISYYAEDDFCAAFDMIDRDSELFTNVWLFEAVGFVYEPDTTEPPAETTRGDLNGDGEINAGDATLVLRYVVGNLELPDEQALTADLNGNGRLDCGDAGLILRMIIYTDEK